MLRNLPRLGSLAVLALVIAAPAHAQIILGGDTTTPAGTTPAFTLPSAPAAAALAIDPDAADAKPVAFAIPDFAAASEAETALSKQFTGVIRADLASTGLFSAVAPAAYAQLPADIAAKPAFADWASAGAQVLVLGKFASADGRVIVQFRFYDVAANTQVVGTQYVVPGDNWRRAAHKVADDIYGKLTNASGQFDSRIAYVTDTGAKTILNLIDHDGANAGTPVNNAAAMQAPRFGAGGSTLIYSADAPIPGKASQTQRTTILYNLETGSREPLAALTPQPNADARFSADGKSVIYSRKAGANNEIALYDFATRKEKVLTAAPSSDTAPSLSPDGSRYVFVSDRDGSPQLYVARVDGADTSCASGPAKACRITSGADARPAWSPAGDVIAFERRHGANTSIGVVKADGTGEQLLTSGTKDAAPAWSPNGRTLVFARETAGHSKLWTIDRSGRALHQIPTSGDAYEPDWSPLQR
jgi:TolB protein